MHSYKAHPPPTGSSGSAFSDFLREQNSHFYNVFPDAKAYHLESQNAPTIPYNMADMNDFFGDVFFQYGAASDDDFGPLQTRAIQLSNKPHPACPHTSLQDYEGPISPPTTRNLSLDACPENVHASAPMVTQENRLYFPINPALYVLDQSTSISPCIYPPEVLSHSPTKVYTSIGFTISDSESHMERSPDIDPVPFVDDLTTSDIRTSNQRIGSPHPLSSRTWMDALSSNNSLEQTPLSFKYDRRAFCISDSPGPSPRPSRPLSPLSTKRQLEKNLKLACIFCRGRKIACGQPVPGSIDKTCNQCQRRSLRCEYPSESRRGMRKKKTNSADQVSNNDFPPTTASPPADINADVPMGGRKKRQDTSKQAPSFVSGWVGKKTGPGM